MNAARDMGSPASWLMTTITIPTGVCFADLQLRSDDTLDHLYFQRAPFVAVCKVSGLDPQDILDEGVAVEHVLTLWYAAARSAGEPPDEVMEDILAEATEGERP